MSAVVIEDVPEAVRIIRLNRPERLNAMNATMMSELHDALDDVAADRSCRVVVLTGTGRGFCSGVDLSGYGHAPGADGTDEIRDVFAMQNHIVSIVPKLRALPQPVIAAVNGPAAGGGLALALASDVRIASETARFNVAFIKVGLSGCDIGVSWLLPRLIGASRAWELMLTGRIIDAERADQIGLVSTVVRHQDLIKRALELAAEITANSSYGVTQTKEVMWNQLEVASLQAGIELENRTQVLCSLNGGMKEAAQAFLEGRNAVTESSK